MQNLQVIKVSIHNMVEFVLRSGSINSGYMSSNRAVEGTILHQKLQNRHKIEAEKSGLTYKGEVSLKHSFTYKQYQYEAEGRADGLITGGKLVVIEEIKSSLRPVEQIKNDPNHWHWAQAKCYGYIYSHLNNITKAAIRLTYGHLESEDSVSFNLEMSFSELEEFFFSIIERYHQFSEMEVNRITQRNETINQLNFPFGEFRKGQRELCVSIYASVKQGKKLFAQAPTGTGKTISALFPSIKALPTFGEKIFYCTAKTITRQVAEDTMRTMINVGLIIRTVTLTAKDKICFMPARLCNPFDCQYANGHFDRVNEALLDITVNETLISRALIIEYAQKHLVCPFEYMMDTTMFCDVIICDYNHVYDPKAKLKRFFSNGGDYIILNDEAHNLVDRSRDMFSAIVSRDELTELRQLFGKKTAIYKDIGKILKYFRECAKRCPPLMPERRQRATNHQRHPGLDPGSPQLHLSQEIAGQARNDVINDIASYKREALSHAYTQKEIPTELCNILKGLASRLDEWLAEPRNEIVDQILSTYFSISDFLRVSELYDNHYITYIETGEKTAFYIKLFCIDPSKMLAEANKKSLAVVFFSATLAPLEYFRNVLGGEDGDFTLRLSSPYPQENLCLMIDTRISTKFKFRELSFEPIAERIYNMIQVRTGNYLVFFSSYAYMNKITEIFSERFPMINILIQSPDMDEASRETFLSQFTPESTETLLAFAVLGGIFSEGVDLKAERLIGVIVVGVGLPMITEERNVIQNYYDREMGRGFEYAYLFPGMNKVMQAVGRVIRSETDRGIALLIDSRFGDGDYRCTFPNEWSHARYIKGPKEMAEVLNDFWDVGIGEGDHPVASRHPSDGGEF